MAPQKKVKRSYNDMNGYDSNGNSYKSLDDVWDELSGKPAEEKSEKWYKQAAVYWEGQDTTVDGMLGGFGEVHESDSQGTLDFLAGIAKLCGKEQWDNGIDIGAGIGRTTKHCLFKYIKTVDILDQNQRFLDKAVEDLDPKQLGNVYCNSVQDFNFEQQYDVVWIQWILLYLPDDDFLDFFAKVARALKPGGVFLIKENVSRGKEFHIDREDNSVTRAESQYLTLFAKAKFTILHAQKQKNLPKDIFPMTMWALQPSTSVERKP